MKTKRDTKKSVIKFLHSIDHEKRCKDAKKLHQIIRRVTGEKAVMWGESIVGYGDYSYTRSTGKEYEWFPVGFSPRKNALVFYSTPWFKDFKEVVSKLGKTKPVKSSVSCVYIKDLDDIDQKVLERLIKKSIASGKK